MKNENTEKLSDAELDIMRLLWQSGRPLKASEIAKLLSDTHTWKPQTVHVLLGRLCEKGFCDADRQSYSHLFYPVIGEEEYLAAESVSLISRVGSSVKNMVASLIDTDGISDDDILELSNMLDSKRREIEKKKEKESK